MLCHVIFCFLVFFSCLHQQKADGVLLMYDQMSDKVALPVLVSVSFRFLLLYKHLFILYRYTKKSVCIYVVLYILSLVVCCLSGLPFKPNEALAGQFAISVMIFQNANKILFFPEGN